VYSFSVGVYVVAVRGYNVNSEDYLKAIGVDFVMQFVSENILIFNYNI
jgi:hypothetical protein